MISVHFPNKRIYIKNIYDLKFSSTRQGGPATAEITMPIDLVNPHKILEDIKIYDNLDLLWCGRAFETPRVTANRQAAIINGIGHINHLTDQSAKRLYSDTSYNAWDTTPPVAPDPAWGWESAERDNINRLFFKWANGQSVAAGQGSSIYYRRANTDAINQAVYSITFNYETGAAYNSAFYVIRFASYTSDFNGTSVDWTLSGSGVLSGSVTITLPASKKGFIFQLYAVQAFSPATETYWAKITNIRVNGLSTFTGTYQADEVIKDILTQYCPKLSTDQTKILTGTFTLPEFFVENKQSPLDILKEVNKYEDYNYGCWDYGSDSLPRLTYEAHDLTNVHYITTLKYAKPELSGESLENQFNSVDVEYNDPVSGKKTATRTATHALLTAAGITRSPLSPLQVNTTSETAANEVGDTFLADRARRQGKGSLVVRGNVTDQYGVQIPIQSIRPGKNIMIRDLNPSPATLASYQSSNVLDGISIFKIEQVDVDIRSNTATLQLDSFGDRLDLLLSRKGY